MGGGSNFGSRPGSRESNLNTRFASAQDAAAISHQVMGDAVLQALDESELAEQLSEEVVPTLNMSSIVQSGNRGNCNELI